MTHRLRLGLLCKAFGLTILSLLAFGCVTSGTHDEVVGERDKLTQEKSQLQTKLSVLQDRVDVANETVRLQGDQMDRMRSAYQGLVMALDDEVERKEIQVEEMKYGVRVGIPHDILFDSGSARLNERGYEVISDVAKALLNLPYQIVVAGHTDNVPIGPGLVDRFPTNWDLASARAASVVDEFEADGVPSTRMVVVAFGKWAPIASNDTPEGRAQNRRIDIRLRPVTESDILSNRALVEATE
jgi:chemotaxis protein MotB